MKGNVVTNTLTIVGVMAISVLMFARVPGIIDDMKIVMSKESVIAESTEIANLLSLSKSAPNDMVIKYKLPEGNSYKLYVKDGYVNVSTSTDWAVSKTLYAGSFEKENVKEIIIKKDGVELS